MSVQLTRRSTLRAGSALLFTGALAGCSGGDGTSTPTPVPEYGIGEFAFATEEPNNFGNFERQPDATYDVSDAIWVYVDVVGFDVEEVGDDQVRIDLNENLVVSGPSGETAIDDEYDLENTIDADARDRYYLTNNISLTSDVPRGDYEAEVTIEDRIGDETTSHADTFTVE